MQNLFFNFLLAIINNFSICFVFFPTVLPARPVCERGMHRRTRGCNAELQFGAGLASCQWPCKWHLRTEVRSYHRTVTPNFSSAVD